MVTRLQNYFNTIDQNNVTEEIVAQLNVRLNKIEPAWEEFNELQSKIELLDIETSQADDHEREQFEEIYFSLTASINTLCKKFNEVTQKEVISNMGSAIFEHPNVIKESHVELRKLFDNVTKHLRSLKILGENTDEWDRLIIYVISNKFDPVTRRDWESHKYKDDLPKMSDLNEFLRLKCEVLEKNRITESNKNQCFYCNKNHLIYNCEMFLKLNINERIAAVKLSQIVTVENRQHVEKTEPLAHGSATTSSNGEAGNVPFANSVNNHTFKYTVATSNDTTQILLSTAIIKIKCNEGYVKCRALLDSGSQSHFISEKMCEKLSLKPSYVKHAVRGVGRTLTNINKQVDVSIMSCYNNFNMNIKCLVIPQITDELPLKSFDKYLLNIPSTINLADPEFNNTGEIDILLGSNVFWSILSIGQERLGQNMPLLQNTQFGWVVAGNICLNSKCNESISCLNVNLENSIDDKIIKFWNIEEINNARPLLSQEEKYCEAHFEKTTRRDSTGRFIVDKILALVMRFINNARLPKDLRQYGVVTPNELDNSLHILIKNTQMECFPQEYSRLQNKGELDKKSKILSLNPFMQNNLIRVGGRLKHSKQSYDKRHPIILPKGHILTTLILRSEHERLLHCGAQMLLYSLEYLSELQTRYKWKQKALELVQVGSLVLVKDEGAPMLKWTLGRITALHPGSDNITRVVDIKTTKGEIRRSVNRICVLPIETDK
ncbi:hypothetical protein NQ317_004277 [Molorchus minor]|uniref:DUF5641 domain-containing protein n=1 Tax=Molorchus minor TaxID=1323400 RepID=A0ABQ9IS83_9CUCU|nr:hypothetical protein NQ317_004277 [Molorchus minor]